MIVVSINGKPFRAFDDQIQANQFIENFQKQEREELVRSEMIEQIINLTPFTQAQEVLRKIMEKK